MSHQTRRTIKKTAWVLGAAFAALVLHFQLAAQAHVATGANSYWCSPHDRNQSGGGSQFFNCGQTGSTTWGRDFYCPTGTACSKGECNPDGSVSACGASSSNGSSSHGKAGGHAPTVSSKSCSNTCSTPEIFYDGAWDESECNGDAEAKIQLKSTGELCFIGSASAGCSTLPGWLYPVRGMSNYEVKATLTGGSTPEIGTLNTWQSLGTTRTWGLQASYGQIKSSSLTFTFRKIGTSSPTWVSEGELFADTGSMCE